MCQSLKFALATKTSVVGVTEPLESQVVLLLISIDPGVYLLVVALRSVSEVNKPMKNKCLSSSTPVFASRARTL